MKGFK